jgi:uncharacterized membrane protein YfcA
VELLGYASAVLMGAVLGLLGSGGSILTVPILVYLFQMDAVSSTGYSLFIVGLSAIFGAYKYHKNQLIHYRVGTVFMIPSLIGVYLSRRVLVPAIPDELTNIANTVITKDMFIMGLFALTMLVASISMIKGRKSKRAVENKRFNYPLIGLEGIGVGLLTGIVGAGGGFLIVPALVLLAGLEMKVAVGTSLVIIAIKSLGGFVGEIQAQANINWDFLTLFSALSVIGILLGSHFSSRIPSGQLKKAFGYFVLVMGVIILSQQLA